MERVVEDYGGLLKPFCPFNVYVKEKKEYLSDDSKRQKNDAKMLKLTKNQKEKTSQKYAPKFWLPSFLDFFQV